MKKSLLISLAFTIAMIIFLPRDILAADRIHMAILDLTAKNTPQTHADIVRDVLEIEFYKTGKYDVLERNQMTSILKEQGLGISGCMDTSCAVQIGRILSADVVVMGSLYRYDNLNIAIKLVDIRTSSIIAADSEKVVSENDMENAVRRLVTRIAGAGENNYESSKRRRGDDDYVSEKPGSDITSKSFNLIIEAQGEYLIPRGNLKKLADPGYGGTLFLGVDPAILVTGIETGYWYLTGEDKNVDYFRMVPLLLSFRYRFEIFNFVSLITSISTGASYNSIQYLNGQCSTVNDNKTEPLVKAGINADFQINYYFNIYAGVGYCAIFENEGRLEFISFNAGCGVKL